MKKTQEIIEKSRKIHQNRYDYSLVEYTNYRTKIKIVCPLHGIFEKSISNFLIKKQGCPECSKKIQYKGLERFIEKCKKNHGDRYDYSLVIYKNSRSKVKIICPDHGIFEQLPWVHSKGHGCPECKKYKLSKIYSDGLDVFIEKSRKIHQNRYDYSLVEYTNNRSKVKIICPDHGIFEQYPDGHINQGQGCPKCSNQFSMGERELQEWVSQHIEIKTNNRSLIKPYELDIIIPSKKIAIEYNGLYWHSEKNGKDRNYHLNKYNLCKDKGYRLIQVWENEWLFKKEIIKSVILNAIGQCDEKIHGRKCEIKNTTPKNARVFYDNNHIQGFKGGGHHGLYYKDELVSLMTIDKRGELQRFVNRKFTIVHGAFSKLLKSFGKRSLFTFADLRYFTGDVYRNNGFKFEHFVDPRYTYFRNMTTYHRRQFQRKILPGKLEKFDPSLTEYQNMLMNGYDRIWDCGKIKFIT